ncbi:MAG: endonuclease [Candidatus Sericytochromatia bacterium]|nr:endonuclease [Candidatus Sericytochromatia bacterium]
MPQRHLDAPLATRPWRAGLTWVVGCLATAVAGCGHPSEPGTARAASSASAAATSSYAAVEGLKGAALLKGLNQLTRKGHRALGYDAARDVMFATIDDPTGKDVVLDVYCGRAGRGVTDRKSAFHRGLNAEHTWPQSLGARQEPAKSDLHHLFPADAATNSQRSNHRYGVPDHVIETLPSYLGDGLNSKVGTSLDGATVFEPRADHKGDVARAIFYFYARHAYGASPFAGIKLDNFRKEFATLWAWHFQDPPSLKERTRNAAIERVQGNRNPFVDRPEFVQRIGHFLAPGQSPRAISEEPPGLRTP